MKAVDHRDDDVTNTARRIAAAITRRSEAKNYNAGPAHVPTETMLQLCLDMLDYNGEREQKIGPPRAWC